MAMTPTILKSLRTSLGSRILKPTSSQKRVLVALLINVVAILVLYNVTILTPLLYPFKILTVAFHESCHALMTWITGGSVKFITLNAYEGGLTGSAGGSRCLILPAGYLGSSTIGAILIFTTFNFQATTIAAGSIAALMLITLFVARNFFAIMTTILVVVCIGLTFHPRLYKVRLPNRTHLGPVLRYVIVMFTGTMSAMYSINDIVADVLVSQSKTSDAALFSKECIYLPSVIWGLLWTIMATAAALTGVLLGLVVWKGDEDEDFPGSKQGSYFTLS